MLWNRIRKNSVVVYVMYLGTQARSWIFKLPMRRDCSEISLLTLWDGHLKNKVNTVSNLPRCWRETWWSTLCRGSGSFL